MSEINSIPVRKRGRRLSFDRDAALKNAMMTFWKFGYETTSVSDLLAAMNISAPSLYTAFGDKERLFIEAVDEYVASYGDAFHSALYEAATAKEGMERMLRFAVIEHMRPGTPKGCLLVTAAATGSDSSLNVQQYLAKKRSEHRNLIKARIQQGLKDGDVAEDVDAQGLSYFYSTVLQGLSIQARGGAKRKSLEFVAALAMQAWPDKVSLSKKKR